MMSQRRSTEESRCCLKISDVPLIQINLVEYGSGILLESLIVGRTERFGITRRRTGWILGRSEAFSTMPRVGCGLWLSMVLPFLGTVVFKRSGSATACRTMSATPCCKMILAFFGWRKCRKFSESILMHSREPFSSVTREAGLPLTSIGLDFPTA